MMKKESLSASKNKKTKLAHQKPRIVLFGAGASFGSGNVIPQPPPQGNSLYYELKTNFPSSWGNLPTNVAQKFQNSFEIGMQEIWNKYSTNIGLLMRHMTLYLAQFHPDDSKENLYYKFIEEIKNDDAFYLISSLNYDLLLEMAVNLNGQVVNYFSENPKKGSISIWKLHGSINFIPKNLQVTGGVQYTAGVSFGTGINPVSANLAVAFCLSGTALYPSMCLYMKTKPTQIADNIIKIQQSKWTDQILKAEKILIIGVFPYLDDKHIWEPLSKTKAVIGFVGSKSGFDKWVKQSKRSLSKTKFIGNRWNTVFDDSINFLTGK